MLYRYPKTFLLFIIAGLVVLSSFSLRRVGNYDQQPVKIVLAMLDSIKKIKSYEFNLKALERVEKGEYLSAESYVKLNVYPKALYFRNEKRKISIMFVSGTNENKALVKAKSLMNAAISLDPYGNMMRKNQHYTIHELGFEYFAKTMTNALLKDKTHISQNLKVIGKKIIGGKPCIGINFEDPNFTYFDHVSEKNESVSSLATRFNISEYQIRLKNELHSFYGTIKTGTKLKIPSNYCKRMVMYLDEHTLLPVTITIFDELGLYENYEYIDVKTNKKFTSADFGKFYKD